MEWATTMATFKQRCLGVLTLEEFESLCDDVYNYLLNVDIIYTTMHEELRDVLDALIQQRERLASAEEPVSDINGLLRYFYPRVSHYKWLEKHFFEFLKSIGGNPDECGGIVGAHGDKCYSYRHLWAEKGIPFEHGVAIYFLTYLNPWGADVRNSMGNTVCNTAQWVVDQYPQFKDKLPPPRKPWEID